MEDAAGARDQFAALLPVFERILGPEHPDTLYIRHSVARWTGQAGDPAGARDQYAALLSERERILGPDHPDTRDARKQSRLLDREGGFRGELMPLGSCFGRTARTASRRPRTGCRCHSICHGHGSSCVTAKASLASMSI